MNKNLYVGNLSQKVTEDDLRNNFSEAGAVATV
jgi:RNA recognition motif-containing protein